MARSDMAGHLVYSSGAGRARADLIPERRALPSNRLIFEAKVGRVARRDFGRTAAWRKSAMRRALPASRFIIRERYSWAKTTMTSSAVNRDPAKARSRALPSSGIEREAPTSKRSSTALLVLLTCWPPGPLARTARSVISASAAVSQTGSLGLRLRRRNPATRGRGGAGRRARPRPRRSRDSSGRAPHPGWPGRRCAGSGDRRRGP